MESRYTRVTFDELTPQAKSTALAYIMARNREDMRDGVQGVSLTRISLMADARKLTWYPNGRLYTP